MRQALHISIWQLSAILHLTCSPLKLCQVGWGQTHIFRFLQKYLIGFNPRLWLGHSRTFTELSVSHSCCVLRVIVLLEGEPSAQYEVLNALDWVFIKAISIFGPLSFSSTLTSSSVPAAENSPTARGCYQHTLLLGWYSAGDEQSWFPSNMIFGIEVQQTRESCFSQSEGPLGSFFCKFQVCFHVSSLRRGLSLATPS